MTMRISQTELIPAPLEQMAEVLCSEAYNTEVELGREGVVTTRYEKIRQDENEVRFVLHSQEYVRKKTGGLDRTKRRSTTMTSCYRLGDGLLTWQYGDGADNQKVVLKGTYRLTSRGDSTSMTHEVEITVRIPLIGGQIAKLIAKEFKKDLPRYQRSIEKHLAAQAT